MKGWRRVVLIAGIAALYFGMLVTGMSLPFLPAASVNLAALLLYTVLMRPSRQWASTPAVFFLTLLLLALFASALTGLGALVGGWLTPLPQAMGPALAFFGVLISRLSWSAEKTEQLDDFLDHAIAEISGLAQDISHNSDTNAALLDVIAPPDPIAADRIDRLRRQLKTLPLEDPARAEQLETFLAPLGASWSDDLPYLYTPKDAASIEAAAHLLLSPEILPAAFGHPSVDPLLRSAFFEQDLACAEATAKRALSLHLDAAECWRLLPSAEQLDERARLLDDPPALSALAAAIAERETEDAATLI